MNPEFILTNEEESQLMWARDTDRNICFLVGRIANNKLRMAARSKEVSYKDVYHAISRVVGKEDRTIRYYAEVESFYPIEAQDKYDILPFNFFNYAKAYDNWEEILDYAMEHPDYALGAIKRRYGDSEFTASAPAAKDAIMFTMTNAISELCDAVNDLADKLLALSEEAGDDQVETQVNYLSTNLKKFTLSARELLANLVDRKL